MKVLQIITSLRTGGAEKLITDITPILNQLSDVSCDVLSLIDEDTPFRSMLEEQNINVMGLSNTISPYSPSLITKIKPFLNQYDIVHTHLFQAQYWTALAKLLARKNIAHLITTEHSTSNRRRNFFFMKYVDRMIYKQYEKKICISDATFDNLKLHLSSEKNLHVITNGVNIRLFNRAFPIKRVEIGLTNEDYVVTMTGGFRYEKDQDTVIKSLKYLPDNVKLVLVGDGVRKKICEKLAKKENVENNVIFLGNRNDVANILKASDVVVMSSHYEGFGLAAVEGMAAEKPVIASDVSGLSNVVGQAGLLFPAGNEKKLADLIIKLINNQMYTTQIARNCYNRAKEYDIEKMTDKLLELYKSVL